MTEIASFAIAAILTSAAMQDRNLSWFVALNLISAFIRLAGPADMNISHPHINMILMAVNSVCLGILLRRLFDMYVKK